MFGEFFYNEHIKRCVAVFGTLFNNIEVRKRDASGKTLNVIKVPISYGPRAKFLARIDGDKNLTDPKLAMKLPRMSFEISSLDYASEYVLQKHNKRRSQASSTEATTVDEPIKYRISFDLNIYSKNQDDVLQILEQIIPNFKPEYTVAVKELNGSFISDMPFSLKGVSLTDDYEGDFNTRRALIYTLQFESYINFYGSYKTNKFIKKSSRNLKFSDSTEDDEPLQSSSLEVFPYDSGPDDDYKSVVDLDNLSVPDFIIIGFNELSGTLESNESVIGLTSGTSGRIININGNILTVNSPDGRFEINETIRGNTSNATINVIELENKWRTAT